jgi:hypothetical protein
MMMSLRRRSQEGDKEEDFVNKAPFVVFSLKRNKYNISLFRTTFEKWGKAIPLAIIIKKLMLLLLLNPKRALLSKGVLLSRV